jgi:hypothetical protein
VKVVEEVATTKLAADKATADKVAAEKVAVDKATTMKAVEEAMAKAAVDAAAMKIVDQGGAVVRTTVGSVGSNPGSSPAPVAGSKRAAALDGSTPPSKQFHCT